MARQAGAHLGLIAEQAPEGVHRSAHDAAGLGCEGEGDLPGGGSARSGARHHRCIGRRSVHKHFHFAAHPATGHTQRARKAPSTTVFGRESKFWFNGRT
jgi:hypothetical protein